MDTLTLQTLIGAGTTVAVEMVKAGADFIGALYSANAIGQLIVVSGIAGTVIAVGKGLFLAKKRLFG